MTTNIEKEIVRGIAAFVESLESEGCDISPYYKPDKVAAQTNARRRIKVTQDVFLFICLYITFPEMVGFSTLCKEFMEYYPHIWNIAQNHLFPNSLFPAWDYINIRENMALYYYYWNLNHNQSKNSHWISINKEENIMLKLGNPELTTSKYEYMDKNELKYRTEVRDNFFSNPEFYDAPDCYYWVSPCIQKEIDDLKSYLQCFRFVSKKDPNNIPYYTIKLVVDSRLYGWDPVKNPIEYATKQKWITGEYNYRYEAIFDGNSNDPAFEYEYDERGVAIRRYRIRPDYC